MARVPPTDDVYRNGNTLTFPGEVRPNLVTRIIDLAWQIEDEERHTSVKFDFSRVAVAFPNAMLPIIGLANFFREGGYAFEALMPSQEAARRLFRRTNWAYLLAPEEYKPSESPSDRHLAVVHYKNSDEQLAVTTELMDRLLRTSAYSRSAINALKWTIAEITDNVTNHAVSKRGGYVQLEILRNRIALCVMDSGQGILRSLRQGYPSLRDDVEAIELAVQRGVTRGKEHGQGNGLTGSLALAMGFQGSVSIRSFRGFVLWRQGGDLYRKVQANPFPGTLIDIQMRPDLDVDIAPLIAGDEPYRPSDFIDDLYLNQDHTSYEFRIADEGFGFGSRTIGKQLRTKCHNILSAQPAMKLLIDWAGVPIVASSFADEFLGKLFVELGPIGFNQRISLKGIDPVVQSIIDKVIQQRVSQETAKRR